MNFLTFEKLKKAMREGKLPEGVKIKQLCADTQAQIKATAEDQTEKD